MSQALETVETGMPAEILAYAQIIERAAANPDVDVAKLEKLMDLQERVMNRRAEMAFNSAFAEMQAELPEIDELGKIVVDRKVRSRYALFEDIDRAVKPVLKTHGFAVTFKVHSDRDGVNITGILMHREGHREATDLTLQADTSGSKNGVQSIGSSVQYGKRYVLCALLNIATRGIDDDGVKGGTEVINEEQVAALKKLAGETKADVKKFCEHFKIDKLENLPLAKYDDAVKAFEKKRARVSPDQAATLQALVEEVKADVSKFCQEFGVKAIANIPALKFADAVKSLESRRA